MWHLALVDDRPLPAALTKPDAQECADVATGGLLTLAEDQHYELTIEFQPKTGCASSYSAAGTYSHVAEQSLSILDMSGRGSDDPRLFYLEDEVTIFHAADLYTFKR
jgi:hypothetical protein